MERLFLTDLDHTLFNTELYYHHVRHLIENEYGVSADMLHKELREETKQVGPYNVFEHARQHGVETDELRELLKQELYGNNYLYDDARTYLKTRAQKRDSIAIITVGYEESQSFKLDLIPALRSYPSIITHKTKAEAIRDEFTWRTDAVEFSSYRRLYDELLLIDDRAETFDGIDFDRVKPIRIKRSYETHSEIPTPKNITEIHALTDIEAVLAEEN